MVALAFATPARADDQAPPPPLMVAKSAVIAPDQPDATVPVDAVVPEPDSASAPAPDPAPVRAVAVPGWKLAAKPHAVHHVAPIRVRPATPPAVVSTAAPAVHASRPHHVVKPVRSTKARTQPQWYQVAPAQYRSAREAGGGARPNLVAAAPQQPAAAVAVPRISPLQRVRSICELRLRKCLQFCSRIAAGNAANIERWIGACISSPDPALRLGRLHALLLQRLWTIALDDQKSVSGRQYQHLGTQYQSGAASFGWELAATRSNPARLRPARGFGTPVLQLVTRGHARVLAALATHRARAAKAVERPSRVVREAGPAAAARSASADWLLRALVALLGMTLLALLLAAGSVLPGPGTVRTRLASKGLSSSRIDFGSGRAATPPRGRGISYRD
jgi:hypothetical protein